MLRPSLLGVANVGLLGGVLACWLVAVFLLARAGRPVLNAVSELRWVTGAPLDPRAGWLTLPPVGAAPAEWTWNRAHLLLGAARLARASRPSLAASVQARGWSTISCSISLIVGSK